MQISSLEVPAEVMGYFTDTLPIFALGFFAIALAVFGRGRFFVTPRRRFTRTTPARLAPPPTLDRLPGRCLTRPRAFVIGSLNSKFNCGWGQWLLRSKYRIRRLSINRPLPNRPYLFFRLVRGIFFFLYANVDRPSLASLRR